MSLKARFKNWMVQNDKAGFYIKIVWFKFFSILRCLVPDGLFLAFQYRLRTGRKLNLSTPVLYNEKIQWLKLNYKEPLLNKCVDKWEVRSFVADKGFECSLVEAWGPYDSFDDIDFNALPDSFIIKLTNGSSFNIICHDVNKFDFAWAKTKFDAWQKLDFFASRREWAYKDVRNRIMCERLISDSSGNLPPDYRFFCFSGEVKYIAVDLDSVVSGKKTSSYFRHIYDINWEPIDARIQYPKRPNYEVPKPKNLPDMLAMARQLARDFPAVRVDLYDDEHRVLFGELTFYHASGYQKISPRSFEEGLGELIDLSKVVSRGQ